MHLIDCFGRVVTQPHSGKRACGAILSFSCPRDMPWGREPGTKHQRLKHAAACRSTCFWGLLVGVLKHAAACRSTLKTGLGLFREKIWNQNINPIPLQLLVRDGQSPSAPGVTRGHTVQKEMGSTLVVKRCICD